jgi:hypothetical protein
MASPSLEIHVPISPTPRFLNMVRCLHGSLQQNGGEYRDAPIILTIGDEAVDETLPSRHPWLNDANVEIRWLPVDRFRQNSYYATALERFCHRFRSDVVLQLDADVLVVRSFAAMIRRVHEEGVFAGMIAPVTPWREGEDRWAALYEHCGLGPVERKHQHPGFGAMVHDETKRFCPPYFNLGVLCAPASLMTRIGQEIYPAMHAVDRFQETIFRCQIAVGLAIAKLAIPYRTLRMRFNFGNVPELEKAYPDELAHVRIVHLLSATRTFNKAKVYESLDSLRAIVARQDLSGVEEIARRTLGSIVPGFTTAPGSRVA